MKIALGSDHAGFQYKEPIKLCLSEAGQEVRLSGWVHRKRDHGGVIFIDLRDHYGLTQVVCNPDRAFFCEAELVRNESVITVTGTVVKRTGGRSKSVVSPG